MKDGKLPLQRLSAKLNTDLDRIRAENAALMASQLASFRTDLQGIATNALTTIEADTKAVDRASCVGGSKAVARQGRTDARSARL